MTITYSNRVATTEFRDKIETFHYRVVSRGDDRVKLRSDGPFGDYQIRFADDGYWIDSGFGIEERFDRVLSR